MKTFAMMSLLACSMFFSAADTAVAQHHGTRVYRRVVRVQPSSVLSRRVVSQPVVTYGGFSHIDDLAVEMEQLARAILWEMHFNYSRNPGYNATYSEAYTMLRQAKAIHRAEHHGNRAEITRIAGSMDELFHHIEDDIASWRPSHRHVVGHGSLFDKMESMEQTLHHLMQDVGLAAGTTDPPPPGLNGNPPLPTILGVSRP